MEITGVVENEEQLWLRSVIERHQQYTGSKKAEALLKNWNHTLHQFVKVVPTEYRKVLEEMKVEAMKKSA